MSQFCIYVDSYPGKELFRKIDVCSNANAPGFLPYMPDKPDKSDKLPGNKTKQNKAK